MLENAKAQVFYMYDALRRKILSAIKFHIAEYCHECTNKKANEAIVLCEPHRNIKYINIINSYIVAKK